MTTEIRIATGIGSVSFTGTSAVRSQTPNSIAIAGDSIYYIFTAQGAGTNTCNFRFNVSGFAIPITATINGFEFKFIKKRGNSGSGSIVESTIQLYNGTSNIGTNKAIGTAYPTVDTLFTYGGSTDLWGTSLTPTLFNTAGFRVAFSGIITVISGNVGLDIDYAEATVYYTDITPSSQTRSIGGAAYSGGGGFSF